MSHLHLRQVQVLRGRSPKQSPYIKCLLVHGDCFVVAPLLLAMTLERLTRHNEQRVHLKALEFRAQAVCVIEPLYIYRFLPARHYVNGDIVVSSIFQHHQASMYLLQN